MKFIYFSVLRSLMRETLGVDLSAPSGHRLIKSSDWEVLQAAKYKSCQCCVTCVRVPVSGKTGTAAAHAHNAGVPGVYYLCATVQRLGIKILSTTPTVLSETKQDRAGVRHKHRDVAERLKKKGLREGRRKQQSDSSDCLWP